MIDLHIHTKYSDGQDDEYEIIKKVKDAGIKEFSICDHDTVEGANKVYNILLNDDKIIFHLGVELSCRLNHLYNGIDIHLLVRDFKINNFNINELVEEMSNKRNQKIQRMVDLVKDTYGISLSQEEIDEKARNTKSFGKPHIYSLLEKYGNYDREIFYKNMRKLKSNDLKLDALYVLEKLKDDDCYVTLAHPVEIMEEYNLSYDDIDIIVSYLKDNGLEGLETKHSKHTIEDYKNFSKIANKYNLIETSGSDYHGEKVKPNVKLGVCIKE